MAVIYTSGRQRLEREGLIKIRYREISSDGEGALTQVAEWQLRA